MLLGHQCDVLAQFVRRRDPPAAPPAHRHRAGTRAVDAGQQPAQGGLAGAGRADHGQPFTGRHRQIDAVQDIPTLHIGEPNVGGGQALAVRPVPRRGPVGRTGRHTQQPSQRRLPDLQFVQPGQQSVDRIDELLDVQRGRGDLHSSAQPST